MTIEFPMTGAGGFTRHADPPIVTRTGFGLPHVGIVGNAGVGKSTLAAALAAITGHQVLAFADAARRSIDESIPGFFARSKDAATKDQPWDALDGKTPRELLISHSERMKAVEPLIWTRLTMEQAARRATIFDDVRFAHEADAIRAAGGVLVHLHRHSIMPFSEYDVHSIRCDITLLNNMPPAALASTLLTRLAEVAL